MKPAERDTIETMVAWLLLNLKKTDQTTTRELEELLENAYKEEENLDRALVQILFVLQTAIKKGLLSTFEMPNLFRTLLLDRARINLAKLPTTKRRQFEDKFKASSQTEIKQSGGGVLEWLSANFYLALGNGVLLLIITMFIYLFACRKCNLPSNIYAQMPTGYGQMPTGYGQMSQDRVYSYAQIPETNPYGQMPTGSRADLYDFPSPPLQPFVGVYRTSKPDY